MNKITAKPTKYKEVLYRSRLEAKWAVFFDEMSIRYEYEPGVYTVPMGGYFVRYRPDFALLNIRTQQSVRQPLYVEVKGVNRYSEIGENDRRKIESFGSSNSLIVLGSFPTSVDRMFDEPNYISNFFLINGQNMPCFFHLYNGEPWLVDQYRAQQDCEKTNNALWMACNACFEEECANG